MDSISTFVISLAIICAGMVYFGMSALKSLILAIEGHKEFDGDSLTRRARTKGWVAAAIWAVIAILVWTFYVDWLRSGSSQFAFEAMGWRIEQLSKNSH